MHELGGGVRPAEGFVKQHVQRSRGQPFFAANYVRHLHQVVVDDVGQVVCGQVVATLVEHLVVEDVALNHHLAAEQVVDFNVATGLHFEAHHVGCAAIDECFDLVGGQGERVAHLHTGGSVVLEVGHLGAHCFELFGGVESNVRAAALHQHVHMLAVDVAAFALLVRAEGAAFAHAFVDVDAQPSEGFVDVILGAGHKAA